MPRCVKILNLLIEKEVAEARGDKIRAWECAGLIKHHLKRCPDCREFIEKLHTREKKLGSGSPREDAVF